MAHHVTAYRWNKVSVSLFICFSLLTFGVVFQSPIHLGIIFIDQSVYSFVISHASPLFLRIMFEVTHFADPITLLLFQSAVLLFLLFKHRDRMSSLFIGGMMGGEILSLLAKDIFARPRPGFIPDSLEQFTYSYPSSHAMISLLFYGFLAYLLARVYRKHSHKIIIYCGAGLIVFLTGLSRIILSVHWLSDVIAGWFLGGSLLAALISSVHIVHAWREEKHSHRHFIYISIGAIVIILSFWAALFIALSTP